MRKSEEKIHRMYEELVEEKMTPLLLSDDENKIVETLWESLDKMFIKVCGKRRL